MKTNDIAKQLRLAADIIESGGFPIATLAQDQVDATPEQQDAAAKVLAEETKPEDPYAELKAAHKAGKVIQVKDGNDWVYQLMGYNWAWPPQYYRIKPEPTFTLPTPPPDTQWHRLDGWKEGDLPQGWRPHVSNEHDFENDESRDINGRWVKLKDCKYGTSEMDNHRRTTRPLVFTHAGKDWTWHKAGDPMPCDGAKEINWITVDEALNITKYKPWTKPAESLVWESSKILGWRYADKPEPREVELGPEDVPPGSVLRLNTWDAGVHVIPSLWRSGVSFAIRKEVDQFTYVQLKRDGWQINRSLSTGKWNPEAWVACSKTVTIEQ